MEYAFHFEAVSDSTTASLAAWLAVSGAKFLPIGVAGDCRADKRCVGEIGRGLWALTCLMQLPLVTSTA